MTFLRKAGVTAVLLALFIGASASAQTLADAQVLRRGNGTEPATLDPAKSESIPDSHIEQDLFEGLVLLDHEGNVVPGTAASWSVSPDAMTYTFKLRPGLKWSNGDPFTAADFVYSFRRAIDPATGSKYAFLFYPIKNGEAIATGAQQDVSQLGVRALDPLTLEIRLKSPTGYFLRLLTHLKFLPVHRTSIEQFGAGFTKPGNLVSNGAFMLKEWTPQSRIVLVRNPNYRDADKVKLTEVDYYPIENENEELKRYRSDALDITDNVPSDQIDWVRQNLGAEFHATPLLGIYYIGFNLTQPPFKDNLKLRQALSMAIDREAITTRITKAGEVPAYSFIPDGIPGYAGPKFAWARLAPADRIAAAKKLYAEAGYGPDKPLKIELRYNTSDNHKKIMIAVASMWHQVLGVDVSLVNEEFKVFLETRKQKKLTQAFRSGWYADYADPNSFAELMQSDAGLNDVGYANADYDRLVKLAAVTVDPSARDALLARAEQRFLDDMPIAPLYDYVNKHLVKPWVAGFAPNIVGYVYSKDISILKH